MKIKYIGGPYGVELATGHKFEKGCDPVEVGDELGKKLLQDHPKLFSNVTPAPTAAPARKEATVKTKK